MGLFFSDCVSLVVPDHKSICVSRNIYSSLSLGPTGLMGAFVDFNLFALVHHTVGVCVRAMGPILTDAPNSPAIPSAGLVDLTACIVCFSF